MYLFFTAKGGLRGRKARFLANGAVAVAALFSVVGSASAQVAPDQSAPPKGGESADKNQSTPPKAGEPADKKGDASPADVVVTGYRLTRGSAGSLVDVRIQEVPRAIQVVTEETLANQMVNNTLDVIKLFPGVERGSDHPGGEHPRVRGMDAFQYLEGTFSGNVIWDSAEFLGSAELLRGPNSIQFGFQSVGGGSINYRLKRPTADAFVDLSTKVSSWGDNKVVVDANQPFGNGNGIRVVAVHEGIVGYRSGGREGERDSAAVMLTLADVAGFKLDLDAEILRRRSPREPGYYFTSNPTVLPTVDPTINTEQRWGDLNRDGKRVNAKISREFGNGWHAVFTTNYEKQKVSDLSCDLYDPNFTTGETSYQCQSFGFDTYSNRSLRLDVLGKFDTFGIKHDFAIGASQLRQFIGLPPNFYQYFAAPYDMQNIYNPRQYPKPSVSMATGGSNFGCCQTLTQWWTQGYFQDRITLGPLFELWVGANYGLYNSQSSTTVNGQANVTPKTPTIKGLSPAASLAFVPLKDLRIYVSYADMISPGGMAPVGDPRYDNPGQQFPTLRLKSIEAGAKWEWRRGSFLNVNAFRTEQPLAYTQIISPTHWHYTQSGLNLYKGVEVYSDSTFDFGLHLNAGFVVLSAKHERTGNPLLDGQFKAAASKFSAFMLAEYTVPSVPKLVFNAQVRHDSSTPLLETGGFNVPGHTLVDFGARYELDKLGYPVTLRVELNNAFNQRYWSPYETSVQPGAPRTLLFSASVRFGKK